jgi:DNA-binding NarL/FixJ family response regulator
VPSAGTDPQAGTDPSAGTDRPAGTQHSVRILVVDDHPIWRQGVARDLADAGYSVVGTAGNGAQALRVATATRPSVVLLDLHLPDLSGAEVTRRLLDFDPSIRVLVLSASGERQDVLDAVAAGATGYLVKSAELGDLLSAVRSAAAGRAVFTPGLAGLVLGEFRRLAGAGARAGGAGGATGAGAPGTGAAGTGAPGTGAPGTGAPGTGRAGAGSAGTAHPMAPTLTERETEILRLVAKGLTYPQIADRLVLSPRTVQNHVQNTLIKLQLHNKAQLVRYAMERGID